MKKINELFAEMVININNLKSWDSGKEAQNLLFKNGSFIVFVANKTNEIEMALRLRYDVFCEECEKNFVDRAPEKMDTDFYDTQFHHLLVFDKNNGLLAGTYRLQTYEMAKKGLGFYSENEFDLNMIPLPLLRRSVEAGRACIRKEYRNSRVLFLLWKGVAAYLRSMKKSVIFGCSSLFLNDYNEGWNFYRQLKKNGYCSSDYMIPVHADYEIPQPTDFRQLMQDAIEAPVLFQKYLEIGSKVASYPAFDHDFGSVDFLTILKLTDINRLFLDFVRRDIF